MQTVVQLLIIAFAFLNDFNMNSWGSWWRAEVNFKSFIPEI